jgi:hypothetical protein
VVDSCSFNSMSGPHTSTSIDVVDSPDPSLAPCSDSDLEDLDDESDVEEEGIDLIEDVQ